MKLNLWNSIASVAWCTGLCACGYVGLEERTENSETLLTLNKGDEASEQAAAPGEPIAEEEVPEDAKTQANQLNEQPIAEAEEEADVVVDEPAGEIIPDRFLLSSEEASDAQKLEADWFDVGVEFLESDPGIYSTLDAFLALSSDEVFSGETSLKASQGDKYSEARFIHRIPRVRGDQLYFRAWVYVPTGATTGKIKLIGFRSANFDGIDVNLNANMELDVFHHDTLDRNWSELTFEEGKWSCLQVVLFAAQDQGFYQVSVDEEIFIDVEDTDTQPGPIDYVEFGLLWSEEGQEDGLVYWDEVAARDRPIPCEYDE